MKNQNIIYVAISLVCVILFLQSCNKVNTDIFEKPANSVKSIETRYYEPILLNDKWITGAESFPLNIFDKIAKIEYFDKFNNILLEKQLRDSINQRYSNFYTRTFYFDPQVRKMSKQIRLRANTDLNNFSTREFKRDSLGRLLSIIITDNDERSIPWWNNYQPESINYDSKGNKTVKQDNLNTVIKKTHTDSDITVYLKQVFKENSNFFYRGIYGLCEYEIITTDTKTGNDMMIITEKVQYETLSSKSMTRYKYNKAGCVVEEEIFKIETNRFYFAVPKELSQEEENEYIKEHYFGSNVEYKSCYEKTVREYDNNNNVIYKNYFEKQNISSENFPVEFNIQNYSSNIVRQMPASSGQSYKTYYEYDYNKANDWVKRTKYNRIQDHNNIARNMYDVKQDNGKDASGKQVEEIIIRKIKYYN